MKAKHQSTKFEKITNVIQTLLWIAILYMTMRGIFNLGSWFQTLASRDNNKTMFDVVLQCQQIASQTESSEWSYSSCLDQLHKTIQAQPKILTI